MTADTKVADLPAKWRAWAKRIRGITAGSDLAADIMEGSAEDLEAALARQEADKTAAPVGQEIAYLDLGVGGYIDLGSAMTDEQLAKLPKGRHALGIIGTYGVDGYVAAPPSAPVGQNAVAWRYWSPSGNCWWTRYVAPTEDTSPESTNWEPLYAAPPAAQTNPYEFAVDQCLVVAHLGIADPSHTREEAIRRLGQLIDFHVQVATDPRTNGGLSLQPAAQAVDLDVLRREIELAVDLLGNVTAAGDSDANYLGQAENALSRAISIIDQQAGKGVDRA